jgi:hypothetical protein
MNFAVSISAAVAFVVINELSSCVIVFIVISIIIMFKLLRHTNV